MTIQGGITEGEIANYLANTPAFFERHADLMASIQLASPHGGRAVSLQQRQMEMLRDKIRSLEQQQMEMVRNSRDNAAIADRLHRFTRALMLGASPAALPGVLLDALKAEFAIPQAVMRLWDIDEVFAGLPFTQGVSDDVRSFAASLVLPYCGLNVGFEATAWFDDGAGVTSLALIPLRVASAAGATAPSATAPSATIGLLVLGSPDPARFNAELATDFLARLGEVASAGLTRLLPG